MPKMRMTRRGFLAGGAAVAAATAGWTLWPRRVEARVFVGRAAGYGPEIFSLVGRGLRELGVAEAEIKGKTVLLKPNLVETNGRESGHVVTNPQVVLAVAEALARLGAARVLVGEGSGHCVDSGRLLAESGLGEALALAGLEFVDLNLDDLVAVPNRTGFSRLKEIVLPATLRGVDMVVSLPKMKTHHWAGATLSMKNLFGLLPGAYYGWPKNPLHQAGIFGCILDINAAVGPRLAIVDGIVGMEGDGPIMGRPKAAGVLVMGRNLPAVDATAARVMGLDPGRIPYLAQAAGHMGPIAVGAIEQAGESLSSVRAPFALVEGIPAHQGLAG